MSWMAEVISRSLSPHTARWRRTQESKSARDEARRTRTSSTMPTKCTIRRAGTGAARATPIESRADGGHEGNGPGLHGPRLPGARAGPVGRDADHHRVHPRV